VSVQLEDILTQYVSFLKIKGRFRDIGYEDQDDKTVKVVAEPFFPEMPKIEAHVSSEKMVVEVVGSNSEHIRSESIQFFEMSGLVLEKVITQVALPDSVKVYIEGHENSGYATVRDAVQATIDRLQLELEEHRVGMTFGLRPRTPIQMPRAKLSRTELAATVDDLRPTEIKKRDIRVTEPRKPIVMAAKPGRKLVSPSTRQISQSTSVSTLKEQDEKLGLVGLTDNERLVIEAIAARPKQKAQSNLLAKSTGLPQETIRKLLQQLVSKGVLRVHAGWYVLEKRERRSIENGDAGRPLSRDVSSGAISDSDHLLTLNERIVMEAIEARPNQKAQSNLLIKPTKLDQNTLKSVLRSLVRKSFLDMKYGWYSLKKGISFEVASEPVSAHHGRISPDHDADLEEQVMALISSQPKRKTQAKLLSKKLKVPVEKVRNSLNNLASKGHLSEKRGWFALVETSISASGSYNANARIIIDAIQARPSGRAQSHLLVKPTRLSKDQVRSILKALVKDGVLECKHGWYQLISAP
jgi:DNA-binding IclR family transcriptional regulator